MVKPAGTIRSGEPERLAIPVGDVPLGVAGPGGSAIKPGDIVLEGKRGLDAFASTKSRRATPVAGTTIESEPAPAAFGCTSTRVTSERNRSTQRLA